MFHFMRRWIIRGEGALYARQTERIAPGRTLLSDGSLLVLGCLVCHGRESGVP
jgi:hypothetical protein